MTGNDGATITDADITVKEGWYTTLRPQEDGSYKLQAGKEYKYTITKDGYKEASGSFTVPDEAGDYTFPVTLQSNIDPADQAAVDAAKKALEDAKKEKEEAEKRQNILNEIGDIQKEMKSLSQDDSLWAKKRLYELQKALEEKEKELEELLEEK